MLKSPSISQESNVLQLDAPEPKGIKQRKATGGGVLRLRPSSSLESMASNGPDLTQRMQAVGHNRAVETVDWLSDQGLLTNQDKQALAKLHPAEVKGLLTVSAFRNRLWNRSDRNNVRRAVLLCAARDGVDKAMQLKQDLLANHRITGSSTRGLSLLNAQDKTSFDTKPLRDRLDVMVIDSTVSQRLDTGAHRRRQETFEWARHARLPNDEPLLDIHDKAGLYKIPPGQVDALLTVSKGKDNVPDLADRQNIRRAVMVCAAKHGVAAAQDLKQRLLGTYRAEPAAVRGFEALDASDAESFEPGVLDERLDALRLDQNVLDRLDEPEARASYAWLSQQNLLDIDDRENLAGILDPKEDLSDLALDEPGIGDLLKLDNLVPDPADRRNIKRALLLCAAKEGMPAALQLKKGLLSQGSLNFDRVGVQLEDVPSYMQLRTPWAKSDGAAGGPTGLWQKLADGRSGGLVDRNALSHGAVDEHLAVMQDEAADQELLFAQQKEQVGQLVAAFDHQLAPDLPPQDRLEALKQVIDITSRPEFLVELNKRGVPRGTDQDLAGAVVNTLGKGRFGLHPALRDAIGKGAAEQRGAAKAVTGMGLNKVAQIPPGGALASDMALHLNQSHAWAQALQDLAVYGAKSMRPAMQPLTDRVKALTTNVAPPSAPLTRPDAQVRFAPQVTGKVFDKDDPLGNDAPEQDLTARQTAALRGTCMMLQFAKELHALPRMLGGNELDTAVANTLRATQNLQNLTIDELQARVKELS